MPTAPKSLKLIIADNQVLVAPFTSPEAINEAFEIDEPLEKAVSVIKKRFSPAPTHIILATKDSGSEVVTLTSEKKSLVNNLDNYITALTINDQEMLVYSWETVKETDTEIGLQLFGATAKRLKTINKLLSQAKLTPISLESLSSIIARLIPVKTATAIYYHLDKDDDYFIVSQNNLLLAEQRVKTASDVASKFENLAQHVSKLGLEIKSVIIDSDTPADITKKIKELKLKTQIKPIEPLKASLIKDSSTGNPITAILEKEKLPPEQTTTGQAQTPIKAKPSKRKLPLLLILGLVGLVLIATGGILISTNALQKLQPTPTPESTPIATPTPTPEPTPKLLTQEEKTEISLIIQNGSGIPGVASDAQEILEALGYTIDSIANADNFDYQNTVIKVKADNEALFNTLKSDLESSYNIASQSASLDEDATADAIIIIGQE